MPVSIVLMTPLLTFRPVAIAVAAAAESVMAELAEPVVIWPWYGKASNDSGAPVYIPADVICPVPMPSPTNRITLLGMATATLANARDHVKPAPRRPAPRNLVLNAVPAQENLAPKRPVTRNLAPDVAQVPNADVPAPKLNK